MRRTWRRYGWDHWLRWFLVNVKWRKIATQREQDPNVGCLLGDAVDLYRACPSRFRLGRLIHPNWIQKPSIRLSISCGTKSMWKTWENAPSRLQFSKLKRGIKKQQLPMTIKKWYNVATVNVMSLTMLSVNARRSRICLLRQFHQTTVWSIEILEKFFAARYHLVNCQAVQPPRSDFTQPFYHSGQLKNHDSK